MSLPADNASLSVAGSKAPIPARRSRAEIFEDPLQFLWAVSYADLLMVLMSFFVIYFEISDKIETSPVNDVVMLLSKSSQIAPPLGSGAGSGSGAGERNPVNLSPLVKQLGSAHILAFSEKNTGAVVVTFSDNVYGAGQYEPGDEVRNEIGKVLELIGPAAHQLALTFVGYSDTSPIAHSKTKVIDSNLILSNLRASKAVEFAVKKGFDARFISTQGMGEHARDTRSLSIRITERGK